MKSHFLFLLLAWAVPVTAQEPPITIRNFTFMVIPYLEDGEKISDKLIKNPDLRNSISIVQTEFLNLKLKTLDFAAKYQKYQQDELMQEKISDIKATFLEYAAPDIYSELSIEHINCDNNNHKARVRIKTFMTSSGELLADKVQDGNCITKEADLVQLVRGALKFFLEDYVAGMQNDLLRMSETGQPVNLKIVAGDDAAYNMQDEVKAIIKGEPITGLIPDLISEWMIAQPGFVKFFEQGGVTDQYVIYEEIRLPLIDPETSRMFPVEKFTRKLRSFIESFESLNSGSILKIKVKINRIGTSIYFTLR